jgi:serine/threonine protein kinase
VITESMMQNQPSREQRPAIPEHELLRLIGRGPGSEVWLARSSIGAFRAVKIVSTSATASIGSFHRELQDIRSSEAVSRLHDGLVDMLQVGGSAAAGYFYCVMELADDRATGQAIDPAKYHPRTLAHELQARRHLSVGECIRLGAAIASALGFLHRQRLCHCDLKPSNIIFINGFPKLADMGTVVEAPATRSHIANMAFRTRETVYSPRADVYALARVLYAAATGEAADNYPALPSHLEDTAQTRDLMKFVRLLERTCGVNSSYRCKSAEDLLTALLAFEFSTYSPRKVKAQRFVVRLAAWTGFFAATGTFASLLWRLAWLLSAGR